MTTSSLTALRVIIIPCLLSACSGPLSTLEPAGPSAMEVARLWWGMLVFFTLVLLAVSALWVYAIRRPGADRSDERELQEKLERRWIIGGGVLLPGLSIVVLLTFGIPAGNRMMQLADGRDDTITIDVTGHQWWWEVQYPESTNGLRLLDEMHIPVDTPIRLRLTSADVIHAFWVPRIAGKLDLIPGRTNELQILAEETGVFHGVCAEFCGLGHTTMRFKLHVHSQESFSKWLKEQKND